MCLYVHAVRTTGMHAKERRHFEYSAKCTQCGVELDDSTHVASHVVAYPCFPLNCCVGYLSLVTCCRSCNSKHQAEEAGACCAADATFCGCGRSPRLSRVLNCCCRVWAP